jgi:hypothetical protein
MYTLISMRIMLLLFTVVLPLFLPLFLHPYNAIKQDDYMEMYDVYTHFDANYATVDYRCLPFMKCAYAYILFVGPDIMYIVLMFFHLISRAFCVYTPFRYMQVIQD